MSTKRRTFLQAGRLRAPAAAQTRLLPRLQPAVARRCRYRFPAHLHRPPSHRHRLSPRRRLRRFHQPRRTRAASRLGNFQSAGQRQLAQLRLPRHLGAGRQPQAGRARARIAHPAALSKAPSGLGSNNAPGLTRLASATFTGEFPLARIDFADSALPVQRLARSLLALHPPRSRRVRPAGRHPALPRLQPGTGARQGLHRVVHRQSHRAAPTAKDTRVNEYRTSAQLAGILMTSPELPADDPLKGSFVLCRARFRRRARHLPSRLGAQPLVELAHALLGRFLRRWRTRSRADGPPDRSARSALGRTIAPGAHADYTFLLAWHFPNRTPRRCGWSAAPRATRTRSSATTTPPASPMPGPRPNTPPSTCAELEKKTRRFAAALRESTIPAAVKDAASANLSTLVTQVCFRTADGEFHGFEGANDHAGCCYGNCTHVWNYETATPHLFPTLRALAAQRRFGYQLDDAGAIHFRERLPHDGERFGFAAADGQMGQIMHAYLDWRLSGDTAWLRDMWPRIKSAIEFAWVPGGWDANRDGVMEGVQHNTYDVEFYGPNPLCGIYLSGRAARRRRDGARRRRYRQRGGISHAVRERQQVDRRQPVQRRVLHPEDPRHRQGPDRARTCSATWARPTPRSPSTRWARLSARSVDRPVSRRSRRPRPAGRSPANIRKTLRIDLPLQLQAHARSATISVQRTYALNDEAALVVCDYGKAERPHIPFPYYAEVVDRPRVPGRRAHDLRRHDARGRRSASTTCARATMASAAIRGMSRSAATITRAPCRLEHVLAVSGFRYHGGEQAVTIKAAPGLPLFLEHRPPGGAPFASPRPVPLCASITARSRCAPPR